MKSKNKRHKRESFSNKRSGLWFASKIIGLLIPAALPILYSKHFSCKASIDIEMPERAMAVPKTAPDSAHYNIKSDPAKRNSWEQLKLLSGNGLSIPTMFSAFLLLALFLSGCKKDWLDAKPDDNLTIPTTLEDFELLLRSNIITFSPLIMGDLATDGHTLSPATRPFIVDFVYNTYTWTNQKATIDVPYWFRSYEGVLYTNIALEGLRGISPINDQERKKVDQLTGQALFQRARIFFELSQLWAPPYDETTSPTIAGIPIRLASDKAAPTIRLSVKESYDLIINDLLTSLKKLSITTENVLIPSKAAAYGQLSRVYLSMRNYEAAGKYADTCLSLYSTLIDYNTLSKTASFQGWNNKEIILQTRQSYSASSPATDIIDLDLYDLYNISDLRKVIYFRKNANGTYTFKGNYNNTANQLFAGITTAEMLLVRAETNARKGNITGAMGDVNRLLQSRWDKSTTYTAVSASSAEIALDIVLQERKKELLLRGQRWSDLRRLNQEDRYRTTLTHVIDSQTFTLEPNSYKYTLPIPEDVVQLGGYAQNQGWEN